MQLQAQQPVACFVTGPVGVRWSRGPPALVPIAVLLLPRAPFLSPLPILSLCGSLVFLVSWTLLGSEVGSSPVSAGCVARPWDSLTTPASVVDAPHDAATPCEKKRTWYGGRSSSLCVSRQRRSLHAVAQEREPGRTAVLRSLGFNSAKACGSEALAMGSKGTTRVHRVCA